MKNKILLVNLPVLLEKLYGGIFKYVAPEYPPLGIAYIAAVLLEKGHDVAVWDFTIRKTNEKEIIEEILKWKPDFLGFTAASTQYNIAKKIIKVIKKRNPSIEVVLGGPHFTALPLKSFNEIPELDYGVVGEGEYSFSDLAEKRPLEDIEGLVFRKGGKVFYKNDFALVKDLDNLPYPARSLLDLKRYIPSPVNYKKLPSTTMITSRGCMGQCDFCVDGSRNYKVRFLSAEKTFEEMRMLKEDFGIEDISFEDDGFTQSKERVFDLCEMIVKNGLKIQWNCMSRLIDTIDEKLLRVMKSAGCYQIGVGVETFRTKTLEEYNKINQKKEMVIESVGLMKKTHIDSRLFLLVGFPEETREDVLNTFKFADSLDPEIFQMCILVPFPGTKLRAVYEKKYNFHDENWDFYLGFCPEYAPAITPYIQKDELIKLFYLGYKSFYYRPKRIIKNLIRTSGNLGLKESIRDIMKKAHFFYKIGFQRKGE